MRMVPARCPKCGNDDTSNSFPGVIVFGCFSSICLKTGNFEQRAKCEKKETESRIARLESQLKKERAKCIRLWEVVRSAQIGRILK
jgi:hypothetical protein